MNGFIEPLLIAQVRCEGGIFGVWFEEGFWLKRLSGLRRIRKCNDFVGVDKDRGRMRGLEVCKKSCHGSSVETERVWVVQESLSGCLPML